MMNYQGDCNSRGGRMSANSKMDTLDFIINVLIDHEKRLDVMIERLERHAEMIEKIIKREILSQATIE
jgi:hypothetical protein